MKKLILNIIIRLYRKCPNRHLIEEDVDHWMEVLQWKGEYVKVIKKLILEKPEFRNLLYYRLCNIGFWSRIIRYFFPPLPTLYLWTPTIGGGLFIQHGFATVLAAKKIGTHCHVNQQVTVGYKGGDAPLIGDNVMITCGAKVLGNVSVGNDSKIGANAVVVKDVPDGATVVGVPGKVIKIYGEKCAQ